jgi:hypothetical protein
MKVDPKTVQEFLRQAHVTTTLQLYAQSDMEAKRDAQGKFLEQLLGDKIHLLTERIQCLSWVEPCVEEKRRNRLSLLE